jgi:hypothetical protein
MSFRVLTPPEFNNSTLKMGIIFLPEVVNGKPTAWYRNARTTARYVRNKKTQLLTFLLTPAAM